MEPSAHRGVFWLPETDEQVAGELTFSLDHGVRLELTGYLPRQFGELETYRVIHGVIQGGKPVTLLDAFTTRSTLGGVSTQSIYAALLIRGAHTKCSDRQRFREVFIHVELLPEWTAIIPLRHEMTFRGNRIIGLETSYHPRKELTGRADGVRYGVGCGFSTGGDNRRAWEIHTTTYVRVRPRQFCTLRDFISTHVVPLQELIALATDHPCALTALHATLRVPSRRRKRTWEYQHVEVFFQPRLTPHEPDRRKPLEHQFLFSLPDLGNGFAAWVRSWEQSRIELDSIYGLFFSARYGAMLLDQRFSYYVQAAEAYHRRRIGGSDVPPEVHEHRMEAILGSVPSQHVPWLRRKLQYSNEPTLRRRLRELLALVPDVRDHLVRNEGRFLQRVLDTRNYYTHHDSRLKHVSGDGRRMYALTEKLRYLMTAVLLREAGFPASSIHERLMRADGYQQHERFGAEL